MCILACDVNKGVVVFTVGTYGRKFGRTTFRFAYPNLLLQRKDVWEGVRGLSFTGCHLQSLCLCVGSCKVKFERGKYWEKGAIITRRTSSPSIQVYLAGSGAVPRGIKRRYKMRQYGGREF